MRVTSSVSQEYTKDPVKVHPLGPLTSLSAHTAEFKKLFPTHPPPLPDVSELAPAIDAETYVFIDLAKLDASPWDFGDFVEHNAWKWHGAAADDNNYIAEVDRRRERGEKEMGRGD